VKPKDVIPDKGSLRILGSGTTTWAIIHVDTVSYIILNPPVTGSGGDNLGSHVATKTVTVNFGITGTTAIYSISIEVSSLTATRFNVQFATISTSLQLPFLTAGSVLFINSDKQLTENNSDLNWNETNKNLGIGVTNATTTLQLDGGSETDLTIGSGFIIVGPHTGEHMSIDGNEIQAKDSATSNGTLFINDLGGDVSIANIAGNVGIGIPGPLTKLHVVGDVRIVNQGESDFRGDSAGAANVSFLGFRDNAGVRQSYIGDFSATTRDLLIVNEQNADIELWANNTVRVVLGPTGDITVTPSGNAVMNLGLNRPSSYTITMNSANGTTILLQDTEVTKVRISDTGDSFFGAGDIGMAGCEDPDHDLNIGGTGTGCNTGTFSEIDAGEMTFAISSSEDMKENIQEWTTTNNFLSQMKDVKMKRYNFKGYNTPYKIGASSITFETINHTTWTELKERESFYIIHTTTFIPPSDEKIGLMANDFYNLTGEGRPNKIKGDMIFAVLWRAIQNLIKENNKVNTDINNLQNKLFLLEERINKLESK